MILMCLHLPIITQPSPLLLALGLGDNGLPDYMIHLVLPSLRLSSDANITEKDVKKIIAFLRDEIRKDKRRKVRRYPGLELMIRAPPTGDINLGAGDSREKTQAFESIQLLFQDRSREHTRDLFSGDITLNQWRERVRSEVKALHVNAGVAGGNGMWDEMGFDDWGRIGQKIRGEYGFLDDLAKDIKKGKRSEQWVLASMDRYGETASATFEAIKTSFVGIDPSVLRFFPGDGTTICRSNCRCRWNIRVLSVKLGNFNASWRLGSVIDHCPTCIQRQRKWRSLKIRRGNLVSNMEVIVR